MSSATPASRGKQAWDVFGGLLIFVIITYLLLVSPIKWLWEALVPELFPRAVEQGLVAPTISWGTTCLIALGLVGFSAILKHVRFGTGKEEAAIRILDAKLDGLAKHLGVEPDVVITSGLLALIKKGKKIEAIEVYRIHATVGLAEAKAHIEALERTAEPSAPANGGRDAGS